MSMTKTSVPRALREKVYLLRILGGMFLSNAVINSVLFFLPNDSLTRVVVWWSLGLGMFAFYYVVYRASERYYEARQCEATEHGDKTGNGIGNGGNDDDDDDDDDANLPSGQRQIGGPAAITFYKLRN